MEESIVIEKVEESFLRKQKQGMDGKGMLKGSVNKMKPIILKDWVNFQKKAHTIFHVVNDFGI